MSTITLKPLDDGQAAVVIPQGKTTIGRGSLPGCSDKKVSRNHAVLEVTSKGEVFLTPTHVNPCFYQPTADNPGQILKKDVPHKLENGDSFSLLPRAYRYQLCVVDKKPAPEQNDLNKGKTNGSAGDALEDLHKEPAKGDVEPADTTISEKPNAKSEAPVDKKPLKEDANSLPKRSPPEAKTEDKKEKEPSPPKENNVLRNEEKEDKKEEEAKADGNNHVGEDKVVKQSEEDPKESDKEEEEDNKAEDEDKSKDISEDKKEKDEKAEEDDKRAESCEESRDEATMDTLPSKVSEGEEETSKPAKRGRKKATKAPAEEKVTKRKATTGAPRGRKKKAPASTRFDFGPGEEGNSSQRVAGRTSSRTNRQSRQGISLEDFIVSDDDEWQSDSSPKRRKKKRGKTAKRNLDDSGSDWEIDRKKPKKSVGGKGGSGSESGSDWGTPKKKGPPKGRRRKGKAAEEDEPLSDDDEPPARSAPKLRIPCTYGKKCYRRSANHVEQFSHPGDSDYASEGEEEEKTKPASVKKECPYGENCFRKNAQHQRDFKHTKKTRPGREAKGKKGKGKSEEVDSYDMNDSQFNDDSADEYKPADSGSDYETKGRSKKQTKTKGAARGGKRGRRA